MSNLGRPLVVAIDFDGTIVEEKWPRIGNPIKGAKIGIERLHKEGMILILNTCRCEDTLGEAVDFLKERKLWNCFTAVNENILERVEEYGSDPRKISADVYVDDRGISGIPPWSDIVKTCLTRQKELMRL